MRALLMTKKQQGGWNGDLSKASTPTSKTITTNTQRVNYSLLFNPTGTKCYCCSYYIRTGVVGSLLVQQFSLSTPRDITTATLEWNSPRGTESNSGNYGKMCFANNGQYLYISDNPAEVSTKKMYKYSLATAWDLSSTWTELANYNGQILPLWWSSDGTKFIWNENENTLKYSETATPRTPNFTGSTMLSGYQNGVYFSTDGKEFYVDTSTKVLTKYALTTARNPSAGMTASQTATLSDLTGAINGFAFDTYGNNLYVSSASNPTRSVFYQYDLS